MSSESTAPTPFRPEPVVFTSNSPSTVLLTNVGCTGKVADGLAISNESECCCCLQSTFWAVICAPWYCCEVCFCNSGFFTDSSVKLDDATRTVTYTVWNWYVPCITSSELIPYDSIKDIGYHRLDLVEIKYLSTSTGISPVDNLINRFFHPMIKTSNDKLVELTTEGSSSSSPYKSWRVSNLTDPSDKSLSLISDLDAMVGMHHFLFGRELATQKPAIPSKYFTMDSKYSGLSTESFDALCFKLTKLTWSDSN